MNTDIYKLNQTFDKINNDIIDYKLLNKYIEEYALLKNKLNELESKIQNKIKDTNFIFDKNNVLLLDKTQQNIYVNIFFNYLDKRTNENKEIIKSNVINENIFNIIKKYLKKDNEKICEFVNSQEIAKINELKDINKYIKQMFCGICSTNNILEIITNEDILDNNILYLVKIKEIQNNKQTFYGEISFVIK